MTAETYFTVAEVAARWRVSNMTIHRMIQAGYLPAIRVGRQYRIPAEAVTAIEETIHD